MHNCPMTHKEINALLAKRPYTSQNETTTSELRFYLRNGAIKTRLFALIKGAWEPTQMAIDESEIFLAEKETAFLELPLEYKKIILKTLTHRNVFLSSMAEKMRLIISEMI